MNIEAIAQKINSQPSIKSGSLRFWGEWFGKPYDNYHKILHCTAVEELLIVEFDGGERLTLMNPSGITTSSDEFSVIEARVVRWEWFSYGKPKTTENLYFFEYVKKGSLVLGSTNVDWYKPELQPSTNENAVEIL